MQKLEVQAELVKADLINIDIPSDNMTIICPVSNEPLYDIDNKGYKTYHAEHGQCKKCSLDYHIDELKTFGITKSAWPVRYNGYICKGCY